MSYVSRRTWKSRASGLGYSKPHSGRIRKTVLFIFLLFLIFEFVTSVFITSYQVESISMEPTIYSGSRLIASPVIYGPEIPFTGIRAPGLRKPVRGDIVICVPDYYRQNPWYMITLDSFFRFFTLQKRSFNENENWTRSRMLKRIIAVPGDTVMMKDFEIFIKPEGRTYFFSETEIMQVEYNTGKYNTPENLPENFPEAGNMGEIKLDENQYFLMGDNRSRSNDSYYWGPVTIGRIKAKVVLQFSPKIKFLR